MKAISFFHLNQYYRSYISYLVLAFLLGFGFYAGNNFNLTVGEGVYLNSPYTIGYFAAMLSLIIIFIATIIGSQLLFKEWDNRFDLILYTTPISKPQFLFGRFCTYFYLVLVCFFCFYVGFVVGQNIRSGSEIHSGFHLWHYLYPFFLFGIVNTLFVCSFLFSVTFVTRNKMLMVMFGLLLYVMYILLLMFSNSPFMTGTLPQSAMAETLSALMDPFGVSSYFQNSKNFTVYERNEQIVPLNGLLLLNRTLFTVLSIALLFVAQNKFSFSSSIIKKKELKVVEQSGRVNFLTGKVVTKIPHFNLISQLKTIASFANIDLMYISKSIVLPVSSLILLFFIGMEMNAEIEKGIRMPQKFASSGLLATTINRNFFLLGALFLTYFSNDIFWRSHLSRFSQIENSTYYHSQKIKGHWLSMTVLITFFTLILVVEALLFQVSYGYLQFDIVAYSGVVVFNTLPLVLMAGVLLLLNAIIKHKYIALGVSVLFTIIFATPIIKMITDITLFQFLSGFNGAWSDFNGYGSYLTAFIERWVFGFAVVIFLWLILDMIKQKTKHIYKWSYLLIPVLIAGFYGSSFMKGYVESNEQADINWAVTYEQQLKPFQQLPQPSITDVITTIDLFPEDRSYTIEGAYILKNETEESISSVLLNFPENYTISNAVFSYNKKEQIIDNSITVVHLNQPMSVGDSASLNFKMQYRWHSVNGHDPMNAIIENGSFMRISRYYPTLGYQTKYEISDADIRKSHNMGPVSPLKKLEDPNNGFQEVITLDMTISTSATQTAIGTGILVESWKKEGRNYFHYKTLDPIPFRFAISSAEYASKKVDHNGTDIQVFYSPKHSENVEHLIENTKLTLDYSEKNFGKYPFPSITFAEISSFTRGFNATAYPATIFMNEDMAFHANLKADRQQDVINELAAHEVAHFWWGTTQINPDQREGAAFLTETLAMYTEMMIFKKMYGKDMMMEKVQMYQDMYESQKGFSKEVPLYKVDSSQSHIIYYKGAVVMVKLSELIGEEKVNEALRNFLNQHKFPKSQPKSIDLIEEFLRVTDTMIHPEIERLFLEI